MESRRTNSRTRISGSKIGSNTMGVGVVVLTNDTVFYIDDTLLILQVLMFPIGII
jgi:hypothetical protein